ncbi:hypothetical protein SDC9_130725 [bioreactor metagenome]|uniref:Uncharacterized protein n=1 Tax=bioreactor metagenome TaxID=1076179 RepID=A0A645D2S0_9ZZZZ
MHGGADENAVLLHAGVYPAVLGIPVEQRRVEKSAYGAEHHHGCHGHGHVLGAPLDHGLGGQHGGRAADGSAGSHQHGGALVHAQQFLAYPLRQQKGAGQHQCIDHHAGHADLADVLEGQAQTVEHDAGAQQAGLGEGDAAGALAGDGGIDGVADQQADDDGQRQRAQSVVPDGRKLRGPGGHGSDGARQQQARNHPAGLVHPALRGCGVFQCCSVHRDLSQQARQQV